MTNSARWFKPSFARNLELAYSQASLTDKTEGLHWYANARLTCQGLSRKYKLPLASVAGVMAALSPGSAWERNVADTETFLAEWTNGARERDLPLLGSYGWRNIVKAAKCASGQDPLDVLGGNKVRAFFVCIMHPRHPDAVCIDRHAMSVCHGRRLKDIEVPRFANTDRKYQVYAKHYVRAARLHGLAPCELQAICWVYWRRITKEREK